MRVLNFSPGPAALPLQALEQARDELLDFAGTGMSVMEQSHRGKEYEAVQAEAMVLIKELLAVPDSHEVLLIQGGAHLQFAMVPMNFLFPNAPVDYLVTGMWGERAVEEVRLMGAPRVLSTAKDGKFTRVFEPGEVEVNPDAAYVHLTSNETVDGVQFHAFPDTGSVPAICDMSSDFLGRGIDVGRFGLIYAGAQKNLGPSGIVIVIASKELVGKGRQDIPKVLRYSTYLANKSMYNTPPTFTVYLVRNVLRWAKSVGGVAQLEAWNRVKAATLYTLLDRMADFYRAPVEVPSRSLMNVVFRLPTPALDEKFVAEAKVAGMVGLKGHRAVGGIRASLYNAVTVDQVKTLASFMEHFAKVNG